MEKEEDDPQIVKIANAIAVVLAMIFTAMSLSESHQSNTSTLVVIMGLIRLYVIYKMIQPGGMLQSKLYFILLFLCGLLVAVGSLFHIMHWPCAMQMLDSGFFIATVFYTVRFVSKKEKHLLDYMKWLWVISIGIISPIVLSHWLMAYNLVQIPSVFFLALLLVYLREMMIKKTESL